MAKISLKRKGLLQMLVDAPPEWEGWVHFSSTSSYTLEKYGLNLWDTAIITYAEKAGHIETKHYGSFGKITESGRNALAKSKQ